MDLYEWTRVFWGCAIMYVAERYIKEGTKWMEKHISISQRMANHLLRKDVITQEDYEIYLFGIEQVLSTTFNLLSVLLLGMALQCVLQMVLLVTAFIVLRSYAGGYHASTPLRCYLLSMTIIFIFLSALKYFNWDIRVLMGLLLVSGVVILTLAPVDTENKPIDEVEYHHYRRKAIIVWAIEVFLVVLCAVLGFEIVVESIVATHVIMAMTLIVGSKSKERG